MCFLWKKRLSQQNCPVMLYQLFKKIPCGKQHVFLLLFLFFSSDGGNAAKEKGGKKDDESKRRVEEEEEEEEEEENYRKIGKGKKVF